MRRETGAITETASEEEEEEECEGKTELIFLYKNPQTKDWGGGGTFGTRRLCGTVVCRLNLPPRASTPVCCS